MLSAVSSSLHRSDLDDNPQEHVAALPWLNAAAGIDAINTPQLGRHFVAVDPHHGSSPQEHLLDLVSKISIPPTHGFYLSFLIAPGRVNSSARRSSATPPVSILIAAYYIHQYPPGLGCFQIQPHLW